MGSLFSKEKALAPLGWRKDEKKGAEHNEKAKVGARLDLLVGSIQTCADRGGQGTKPVGEDSQIEVGRGVIISIAFVAKLNFAVAYSLLLTKNILETDDWTDRARICIREGLAQPWALLKGSG